MKCTGNALNLFKLNKVRRTGGMHRKVLIGAPENVYLAAKWKTIIINYDLVEINRLETIIIFHTVVCFQRSLKQCDAWDDRKFFFF